VTAGAHGCTSPPGTSRGVTANQIKVAVLLVQIVGPAANGLFGIPGPDEQRKIFEAIVDALNREGGIACRKVVVDYMAVNPADQSDMQSKCLDVAEAGDFAAIDLGSYQVTGPLCFAQHQVPYIGGTFVTQRQADQGFPYIFALGKFDQLHRDTVFGFHDRGAFTAAKGFRKLGVFFHHCYPELMTQELAALHRIGLSDSQISTYDFGCPTAFATPSDVQQAILKFKSAGVSHVTYVNAVGDVPTFTTVAEQQGFRPQYLLPDEQLIGTAYGTQRPNANNMANALVITDSRNGEERTPGMSPTGPTARCDAVLASRGLAPTYRQNQLAGNGCDQFWMLKAAVEHALALRADALPLGLQRANSVDFSYPQGPNDFSGDRVTTAGQFWRVDQFFTECACFRVIDPVFRRGYK